MASPRPLTIVELAQLTQFKDETFPQTFIANANCVFDHDHNDIKTILNARDIGTLKQIRDALLIEIEKLFPRFPAMSALSRTETPDDIPVYIQDILLLGASFAKRSQAIHLSNIYAPAHFYQDELDLSQLDLTDMAVLVPVVQSLMQNVESNNRKIAKLSHDNELLRIENTTLKSQHANKIAIINATLGIEDQITPDSPKSDEPINEPVNAEPVAEHIEIPFASPRPDKPSPKIVAANIYNLPSTYNAAEIQKYVASKSTINLKQSDIRKLNLKDNKKTPYFEIAIPEEKLQVLLSIWSDEIIALPKETMDRLNRLKVNSETRSKFQKKPFRKPNPKPYRQSKQAFKPKWIPPPSERHFRDQFRYPDRDQYRSQFRDPYPYLSQFRDRDSVRNQPRDFYHDQYRGQFIDEYQNRYPY